MPGPTFSRRRLLAGGAAFRAIAAIGGAVFARRGGNDPASGAGPTATSPEDTSSPTPAPRPRGGALRIAAAASLSFDTFDALRTGQPPVVEVLGRTHSRLLRWTSFSGATLGPDLAARWEQPEHDLFVLHLDAKARWQERAPLHGRPVSADDVAAHFRRAAEGARGRQLPFVPRAADFAAIRRVSAPGGLTVRFELEQPDAFFAGALAGRFSLVQAPEAVTAFEGRWSEGDPETVVGSGPFIFERRLDDDSLAFRAFGGSHRPPLLDSLTVSAPGSNDSARFLAGELDEVLTRDRRDAAAMRAAMAPGTIELPRFEDSPIISSMNTAAPPWNNAHLRLALSAALNRGRLASRLFGGRAAPAGYLPPAFAGAPTERELLAIPGYGSDPEEDARQTRALWAAGGGPALGAVTVDIPSIFDPRYSAGATVTAMLNEVLGAGQFRPAVESYTTIAAKAAAGQYGGGIAAFWFGWGPAFSDPDPARYLIELFGAQKGASLLSAANAAAVARLATEFDSARRQAAAHGLAIALAADAGAEVLPWLLQRSELFRRPGVQGPPPSAFWDQHLDRALGL
ncbi:MAG: ABC transporter substrate-binding protein [Tepidiformaceae bacterium]